MATHSVYLLMGGFSAHCRTLTWQGRLLCAAQGTGRWPGVGEGERVISVKEEKSPYGLSKSMTWV